MHLCKKRVSTDLDIIGSFQVLYSRRNGNERDELE